MKNILVPIDFSTYSISAAKTAAALAAKSEGRIHLLHLLPEVPVNWDNLSVAKSVTLIRWRTLQNFGNPHSTSFLLISKIR